MRTLKIIVFVIFCHIPVFTQQTPYLINGVPVPSDFPAISTNIFSGVLSTGKIFLTNWNGAPYYMIFENDGTPYFYHRAEEWVRDFKLQPTGILTRFRYEGVDGFIAIDSSYRVIDTLKCVNDYETNPHELIFTENGSYYLIATGFRQVDMSVIVPGGDPEATIVDNHIQGFKPDGSLFFEWLCYDYFNITDATYTDQTASKIDWVHMNSIAVDYDGHLVISSRHLSEVTKININTGEMIWRLGGNNNQFDFPEGDPGLSYQHDARPVEGKPGQYTIFDNGNFHSPRISRAVEFFIDTVNLKVEKIWEYKDSPPRYTPWMGNVQRLSNGNSLINYADASLPKVVEVTPAGEKVFEADFISPAHCYRSFRFDWNSAAPAPYLLIDSWPDKIDLIFNKFGDNDISRYIIWAGFHPDSLERFDSTDVPYVSYSSLVNDTTYYFAVSAINGAGTESAISNIENIDVSFLTPGENLIRNGSFNSGSENWNFCVASGASAEGNVTQENKYKIDIQNPGNNYDEIVLYQENLPLVNGHKYRIIFNLQAESERIIEMKIIASEPPYYNYSSTGALIAKTDYSTFQFDFTMENPTDYNSQLIFNCGRYQAGLLFDNISVRDITTSRLKPENSNGEDSFLAAYPNPFNNNAKIFYRSSDKCYLDINIFNILGEKISEVYSGYHQPGISEFPVQMKNLPSGIYLCILLKKIDNIVIDKNALKLLLLK